jgi:hypothetical protein
MGERIHLRRTADSADAENGLKKLVRFHGTVRFLGHYAESSVAPLINAGAIPIKISLNLPRPAPLAAFRATETGFPL